MGVGRDNQLPGALAGGLREVGYTSSRLPNGHHKMSGHLSLARRQAAIAFKFSSSGTLVGGCPGVGELHPDSEGREARRCVPADELVHS